MWQIFKDFFTSGPTTTDRAPVEITGPIIPEREQRRREKQRPGATLSYQGRGADGRAGLITAAKWFSRGR